MRETLLGDLAFADCPIIVILKVREDVVRVAGAVVEGTRQGGGGENDGEDCRNETHFGEEIYARD